MAKKVKKKINKKGLFVLLLTLYLFIMLIYYVFTMPIKTIIINGNNILKDSTIIDTAKIGNYPSLFRTTTHSIQKKILSLELVNDVDIKKSLNGTVTINIEEEKILFFNKTNEKYVLSNNKEVELDEKILGIPVLINYTPTEIYEELNKKMTKIDSDIISLISEIEYNPDKKGDVTLDEYRFLLRMNDGNKVFINIANFDRLQEYKELYPYSINEKGTFFLDLLDISGKGVVFTPDSEINNTDSNKEGENDELPE